jgi:ribose transport system ATP-binding protein
LTSAELEKPVLQSCKLQKSFGSIDVLKGIDLTLCGGEVLALLGENGAGKSTLVKLLGGYLSPSGGDIYIQDEQGNAQAVDPKRWDHHEAERRGIVLIHQELNLAEQLSAADNIFLGSEITRGPLLDKTSMRRLAREHLLNLGCDIDVDRPVSEHSVAIKQLIEIAKASIKNSRVLILDEPTAVLTSKESQALFKLINSLKSQGVAIVYISHKLEEIEQISDRVLILRDGENVGEYDTADLSRDDMAQLMVGRELSSLFPEIPPPDNSAKPLLSLRHGSVPGHIANAEFDLRPGEILGFAGLVGSGRTALMEALVGLRQMSPGSQLEVFGQHRRFSSLAAARDAGISYLTKDRKGQGLLLDKGLPFNFSLFALSRFSRLLIDEKAETEAFDQAVNTFDIRLKDRLSNAGKLSGGNQQKLLLAKTLASEPRLIIIDEPTRGIDIGTKSQIYHFIASLAADGHGIIVVSSDLMEVIGLSHRVAVMCRGTLAGILQGTDINEAEIMRYAAGIKSDAAGQALSAQSA